MLTRKVFNRH